MPKHKIFSPVWTFHEWINLTNLLNIENIKARKECGSALH